MNLAKKVLGQVMNKVVNLIHSFFFQKKIVNLAKKVMKDIGQVMILLVESSSLLAKDVLFKQKSTKKHLDFS